MKNRLLSIFLLLGCMIGHPNNLVASNPPSPSKKAPEKPKAKSPKVIAAEKRYEIFGKIRDYHQTKLKENLIERVADDKLAGEINGYFNAHLNEITQDSSTTELVRFFVKDLILDISTQAYEIAKNVLKLSTAQKDAAKKAIDKAKEIAKKNIDHLPKIEVLTALSNALSKYDQKDKETAINLPKEVLKLLGQSNAAIARTEFLALDNRLIQEYAKAAASATAPTTSTPKKPAPTPTPTTPTPQEEPKPEEPTGGEEVPPPAPEPMPMSPSPITPTTPTAPTDRAALLRQIEQGVKLKKIEKSPTTPTAGARRFSREEIQAQSKQVKRGAMRPVVHQLPPEQKEQSTRETMLKAIREQKTLAHSKESVELTSKADLEKKQKELETTQKQFTEQQKKLEPNYLEIKNEKATLEKTTKRTKEEEEKLKAIKYFEYLPMRLEQIKGQLATIKEALAKIPQVQGEEPAKQKKPTEEAQAISQALQVMQQRRSAIASEDPSEEDIEEDALRAKQARLKEELNKLEDFQKRPAQGQVTSDADTQKQAQKIADLKTQIEKIEAELNKWDL